MLDFNIVYGILVAIIIWILIKFIFPLLKDKGIQSNVYKDIKTGLLLFGYAFREEKVKRMIAMLHSIVSSVEELDIAPSDKKDIAVVKAFDSILDEFHIALDEEAIELMVNILVAYLPPTHEKKRGSNNDN